MAREKSLICGPKRYWPDLIDTYQTMSILCRVQIRGVHVGIITHSTETRCNRREACIALLLNIELISKAGNVIILVGDIWSDKH